MLEKLGKENILFLKKRIPQKIVVPQIHSQTMELLPVVWLKHYMITKYNTK